MDVSSVSELSALTEGAVFELGELMPKLVDGSFISWRCMENTILPDSTDRRIMLYAFWLGVFLFRAIGTITADGTISWRIGG